MKYQHDIVKNVFMRIKQSVMSSLYNKAGVDINIQVEEDNAANSTYM